MGFMLFHSHQLQKYLIRYKLRQQVSSSAEKRLIISFQFSVDAALVY